LEHGEDVVWTNERRRGAMNIHIWGEPASISPKSYDSQCEALYAGVCDHGTLQYPNPQLKDAASTRPVILLGPTQHGAGIHGTSCAPSTDMQGDRGD